MSEADTVESMTTMTVGEAAYRLDLRPRDLYGLVEAGVLELVKVEGRWVVRQEDLPVVESHLDQN